MSLRILLSILLFMSSQGMDKKDSASDNASKKLHHLLVKVEVIVNKRRLLPFGDNFDPSQENVFPMVKELLEQGADPNYKLAFMVRPDRGEKFGWPLPTSMELAQKLKYQEIVNLFSAQK